MVDVSVGEAAERLGVHRTRVRQLLASGRLVGRRVGALWLVDSRSLEQRLETAVTARGRPLSTRGAWSAAALLDGQPTSWLATSERSRLRARLARPAATETRIYRWWMRSRGAATRYRIGTADIAEFVAAEGIVVSGVSATEVYDLGLGHGGEVEAYTDAAAVDRLVREFFLVRSERGNLALHTVDDPTSWHRVTATAHARILVVPRLVAAVDLLDSDDSRSHAAGARLLAAARAGEDAPGAS